MAASTSTNNHDYDVFINHCGPDTKKIFASLLYRRLLSFKVRVFLDQEELPKGDDFSCQIERAIKTASVQVAIFSTNYADSKWCLDELVLMLETLETGATVIPVFYDVEPSELRWTQAGNKGRYAVSLQRHETPRSHGEQPRYDSITVEKWRSALRNAADLSGFELNKAFNGDVGKLLDAVVELVLKKVKKTLNVAEYPTGLDEKVKEFENKILSQRPQSANPQLVGIVGQGGIGKSTLAKELFIKMRSEYSRSCHLKDVRENASQPFLISLQKELLKSLIGSNFSIDNIKDIDEGIGLLKKHLSSHKVLVILDDVDDVEQIKALLPRQTVLPSNSLILITSRNKNVLISAGVVESSIYELTGLSKEHSRELFCSHSFNQRHPHAGFENIVEKFLKACDGLPLSLTVIGALLCGQKMAYWTEQLVILERVLPEKITVRLRISYEALDDDEKNIFLDIACFFTRQNRDTAIRIWDGVGIRGWLRFENLRSRCLVTVNSENGIHMHAHLRDMGREVAAKSLSPLSPLRVWRWKNEDINLLLQPSGVFVRGIKLDDSDCTNLEDYMDCEISIKRLQLLDTEGGILERVMKWVKHPNLIWLRWKNCPHSSLPSGISMKNLRVLQVNGSKLKTLWQEVEAPMKLRELEIYAPLRNIPKSIGRLKDLERIVVGRFLQGRVNLTELPEEFGDLQSLKALVLKECSKIRSLPDSFCKLTALEHIDLSFCRNLERLPNSFGNLWNLQHMDLSNCYDLEMLPDTFGSLRSLQHIDLRGCHSLRRLPDSFGNLSNLQHINLSNCNGLKSLPDSFCGLSKLQDIDLSGCHNLKSLPDSFGNLTYLQHVNLSNCHDLETLPDSLDNLRNLKCIDLSRCHNLERLPNALRDLSPPNICLEGCSYLIN